MYNKYLTNKRTSLYLFAFIFSMYSIVYMTKHCYSAAMTTLVYEGIMTKSQTGLINAIFYLVYAPFQIIGGRLADKHNPGRLIAAGMFGSALANLIIYLNQNYAVMIVTWSVNAIFQSVIWPATFKITSSNLALNHRQRGAFYISFASHIGLFLAYFVAMFVRNWQDNFLFSAISQFVLAIMISVIYPRTEKQMIEEHPAQRRSAGIMPDKYEAGLTNRILFQKSGLFALVAVTFLYGLIYAPKTFASVLLMESYENVSPFVGNFLFLFTIVAAVIGSFGARSVYSRFINNEIKAHLLSVLLYIPCLVILLFMGKVPITAALSSLIAISLITGLHFTTSYVSMRFARFGKNAEVAGIINCAAAVNLVVVNYGLASLADHCGWVVVTAVGLGMAVLAVLLLAYMLPKWNRFIKEYDL